MRAPPVGGLPRETMSQNKAHSERSLNHYAERHGAAVADPGHDSRPLRPQAGEEARRVTTFVPGRGKRSHRGSAAVRSRPMAAARPGDRKTRLPTMPADDKGSDMNGRK
ncbi:hypothetical protein HPB50_011761 [Hyalomma asiaticum]|uniref:Uncharacterized protein n=1 Tax=Hyalomma asiaticum TaxID=266040 RepID=A0ACB7TGB3_HYAAI|nr:hypothetical protein HPB50_011761 [Hyalomma asiaticum]